jgi:hypothetical protein
MRVFPEQSPRSRLPGASDGGKGIDRQEWRNRAGQAAISAILRVTDDTPGACRDHRAMMHSRGRTQMAIDVFCSYAREDEANTAPKGGRVSNREKRNAG